MIESSEKIVALSISEKIDSTQKISVCGLKKIDLLITELPPDDALLMPYRSAGLQVI